MKPLVLYLGIRVRSVCLNRAPLETIGLVLGFRGSGLGIGGQVLFVERSTRNHRFGIRGYGLGIRSFYMTARR